MSLKEVECAKEMCYNTFMVNRFHYKGTEKCRHCGGKDRRFWLGKMVRWVVKKIKTHVHK